MRRTLTFLVLLLSVVASTLVITNNHHVSASSPVVVGPGNLVASTAPDGWYFWNDKNDIPTGSPGELVAGPATPPLGTGSVRLGPLTDNGATAAGHSTIATNKYFGTALSNLTSLSYSTFQPGPTLAIAVQFDVRYRTADTAYGGRLVFEPYQNGAVTVGSGWQNWSPLAGIWWASKTNAAGTGGAQVVALPAGNCAQASPCTWAQINAAFPAAAIYGRFLLKAGSNWNGFDGNADNLTVGVSGVNTTYDFEPQCSTTCYVRTDGSDANTGQADTPADAKKTIQAAVNAVSSGGTVHVASGAYVENVTITTPLTLVGAGAATTTVRPAVSNPNCGGGGGGSLCAGGSNIILVQANNVTIHDIGLDGDNTSITSGVVVGGADLDARNGIITNHLAGAFNNLVVHDVTIKNIFLRGMYASSGGTFDFNHDTIQNVQADPASIAMFNFGGAGLMTDNNVSDANDAISSNHSRGVQYLNNVVTNSSSGVHTDNAGDGGGTPDLIQNNTITNSPAGGYGIWVFVPYIAPTFTQNTVTNVEVGIADFGQGAPVTTIFSDNNINGQNKANSIGVAITTDQLGFGAQNTSVSLTGNIIANNVEGFDINADPSVTATVNASKNSISGNTGPGATTSGTGTLAVDLRQNWWGNASGPTAGSNPGGTGDSVVTAAVIYSPWLGIGVDASPSIGFQVTSPMTWVVGPAVCGATCIQAAIDDAANGDEVDVRTGTFPEHVIVNKSIVLTHTSMPIIDGGGSGDVVTVTVPNVTVDGFEIRNGTNGIVVTSANNATVKNNNIHNFTSAGLRATSSTGANYNTNTITGPHAFSCVGGFWGMQVQDVSGTLNANIVSGIGNGITSGCQEGRAIEADGAGTLQITNNNVSQYQKSGIIVRDAVASTISGNTTAGEGASAIIAANGITITSTGSTQITGNHTSAHRYTPESDFSCGILYFPAGNPASNALTVSGNDSTNDEVGICATNGTSTGAVSPSITGNVITHHSQQGINADTLTNALIDNNTIDGQAGGTTATPGSDPDTDTRYYGIFAVDSSGTISNNIIKGITHGPSNGIQSGVGIRVTARAGNASNVTVNQNNLSDIQKNAMVITNTYGGSAVNANVTNNTVAGNGPVGYIAQNGIQVSSGASATVSGNNVSGYDYTPTTVAAIGVLVFDAGAVTVSNNVIHDLMEGMYVENTQNVIVSGNSFTNYRDTAIVTLLGSSNGAYSGNTLLGKPGSFGIYVADNSTNNAFTTSAIRNNQDGITVDYTGSGAPTGNTFHQNCIAGNTTSGFTTVGTQVGGAIDATNNWWGRVNGANPPGNGDVITPPATINATPFLTAAVAGCPTPADGDGDGINDPVDNCPTVFNPDQKNLNGEVLLLPKPSPVFNDATNPSADKVGDACDPDIDGDGIPNAQESALGTSPYVWDTDGDRVNDGTEVKCGSNPLVATSTLTGTDTDHDGLPDSCETLYGTNPLVADTDGDGVRDGVEVKYWMSNPLSQDTDGDGCGDAREIATVDGNRTVNSTDLFLVASHFGQLAPEFRPYDSDGNGVINSTDLQFDASHFGGCKVP